MKPLGVVGLVAVVVVLQLLLIFCISVFYAIQRFDYRQMHIHLTDNIVCIFSKNPATSAMNAQ